MKVCEMSNFLRFLSPVAPGGPMSTTVVLQPEASPAPTLAIRPWPDGVIDALGHDPRSQYVERFWLGILGPST
ncbi:MAG: hypothetical protein M3Z84_10475, partial [Actinomycetota bacterium]|nr:hypothetical protein [Actinomycetota bacterium]